LAFGDDIKYRSIAAKRISHDAILRDVKSTIIRDLQNAETVSVRSGRIFQLLNIRGGMPDIREIIFDIQAIKKYKTHGFVRRVRWINTKQHNKLPIVPKRRSIIDK